MYLTCTIPLFQENIVDPCNVVPITHILPSNLVSLSGVNVLLIYTGFLVSHINKNLYSMYVFISKAATLY